MSGATTLNKAIYESWQEAETVKTGSYPKYRVKRRSLDRDESLDMALKATIFLLEVHSRGMSAF